MFGLFKTKSIEILAPVSGEVIALEDVNDAVFAQKIVGDGVAIVPSGETFVAPFDGKLTKLFPTLHAYSMQHSSGVEVIVHIGIDTVELAGDGFEVVALEGAMLKAGEPIIKADLKKIQALGKEIVTPIIISNMAKYRQLLQKSGRVEVATTIMEVQ